MYLSPVIDSTALWLLCACALCVLMLATIYFARVRNVVSFRRKADAERPDKPDEDYLPASVIVYSDGSAENLEILLRSILAQDYPTAFEVIVINEGESPDVRDTVSMLRASHPNIYLTFTPEGVVNLSRKKLGITLGVKAARYDVVVLTTTSAIITSEHWLKRMMQPFGRNNGIDIVLGFATVDPEEDDAYGKRRRAFDFVADNVRWLAVAAAGKPFRGTEHNIAYRKETFMANKGFARALNLHYGDDDIFVSEIVRPGNTALELSEDSIVQLRQGNHPRMFRERVLRRYFTEGFIRRRPRFLHSLTGWLQIAAIVLAAAAGYVGYPNMQAAIVAAVIVIIMLILDIWVWRAAMKALRSRNLRLTLPWFSITYPFRKITGRIHSRFGHGKKYTWN